MKPETHAFSRERLRRVLRKKTSAEQLRIIYVFTSSHLHIHILTYISAHVHICTSTSLLIFIFTSLLMFTSAHLHLCSSSHPHIYSSHLHLSLFLTFSLKAGGSAAGPPRNATICGDRACRTREMQARVRFVPVRRNPLRRSRVSSARNAGESAICPGRGQPSAEIARVECAKCLSGATLCGDRACRVREMQARVRFGFLRRNAGESAT